MRIFVSQRRKPNSTTECLEARLRERFGQNAIVRSAAAGSAAASTTGKGGGSTQRAKRKPKHRGKGHPKGARARRSSQALENAQTVLVLVDDGWAAAVQAQQAPARLEVEQAMSQGRLVIPVPLDGARMPSAEDLPSTLRRFAALDPSPIAAGAEREHQVQRLIGSITEGAERRMRWAAKERAARTALAEAAQRSQARPWPRVALVAVLLLVILVALPVWFATRGGRPALRRDVSAASDADESSSLQSRSLRPLASPASAVRGEVATEADVATEKDVALVPASFRRASGDVRPASVAPATPVDALEPAAAEATVVEAAAVEPADLETVRAEPAVEESAAAVGGEAPAIAEPAALSRAREGRGSGGEDMVLVAGGTFRMGNHRGGGEENQVPVHEVTLRPFLIDRTEVTVAAYRACIDAGVCEGGTGDPVVGGEALAEHGLFGGETCNISHPDRDQHPVNCVSFRDAQAYCGYRGARLPTEAEWEFAAEGEAGLFFPWGNRAPSARHLNACDGSCEAWAADNDDPAVAMYAARDGFATTAPVGSFPLGASRHGIVDMAGNVWEWVADWYGPYHWAAQDNPTGPERGTMRTVRGGSYYSQDPSTVRRQYRLQALPEARTSTVGFRCVRDGE